MDLTFITRDPDIMSGTPCFSGTRVPVNNLFDYLLASSLDEFLEDFPSVSREAATQVVLTAQRYLVHHARAA